MSTPNRHARELLPEHRQHGAHAAADLEEARPRLELRAVADQAVAPVLRLLYEALLLGRPVTVDVRLHGDNRSRPGMPTSAAALTTIQPAR